MCVCVYVYRLYISGRWQTTTRAPDVCWRMLYIYAQVALSPGMLTSAYAAYVSIRQHTSAYVSMRQHKYAYVLLEFMYMHQSLSQPR